MSGGRRRLTIGGLMGLVLGCGVVFAALRATPGLLAFLAISGLASIGVARIMLWLAEVRPSSARWARLSTGLMAPSAFVPFMYLYFMAGKWPTPWDVWLFLSHSDAWLYVISAWFVCVFLTCYPALMIVAAIMGAFRWRRIRREASAVGSSQA